MKKLISGKVREVYEIDASRLVIHTTDRVSAYDVALPKPVPGKGAALNAISNYWFGRTRDIVPNHLISAGTADMPEMFAAPEYDGRVALVKKLRMLPYEFIVRGYIFGNMWKAYENGEPFCGQRVAGDYQLAGKLAEPAFTPSTKVDKGHDVYIPFKRLADGVGADLAGQLRDACLRLYADCARHAAEKGLIIADTKFEFGLDDDGTLTLADEALTPDSSRFWDAADYRVGVSPKSYDKQFLRDWLTDNDMRFDAVPDEIIAKTAAIYAACREKITGETR